MNRLILPALAACAAVLPSFSNAQNKKSLQPPAINARLANTPVRAQKPLHLPFKLMKENVSYGIGMNFGRSIAGDLKRSLVRQRIDIDEKKLGAALKIGKAAIADMKRQGIDIDEKLLVRGFSDGVSGVKGLMNNRQMGKVFQDVQKQMLAKRVALRKKENERLQVLAEKNKKAGAVFLAKNGKRDGVKTLKSGLQYLVIRKGKGKKPKATDIVVTHYRGKLIDGTEFDNSIKRGRPATFLLNGVIKGWIEALQLMKVGAKWKLFIPSDLAYGPQGSRTGSIGPNEVLVFDIELIAIKAPPKKKPKGKSKPSAAKKSPRR